MLLNLIPRMTGALVYRWHRYSPNLLMSLLLITASVRGELARADNALVHVGNDAPIVWLRGIPKSPIALGEQPRQSFGFDYRLANAYSAAQTGNGEGIIQDGEFSTIDLRWQQPLSLMGRIASVSLSLPWRSYDGGIADPLIEAWHDVFGFPQGGRKQAPRDRLLIEYRGSRPENSLSFESAEAGFSDPRINIQLALRHGMDVYAELKVPVASSQKLLSDGALALSLGVVAADQLQFDGLAWQAYAGMQWREQGVILENMAETWLAFSGFSLALALNEQWHVAGQLDWHSAPYQSSLAELGDALLGTLSLQYEFDQNHRVNLGFSEDLKVAASPDIVFNLSYQWHL